MSSSNHSKKRNSALLWEFLVKKISSSLVEGDQKSSARALKLLKKHFKPGTELHREFRLINSLLKTTVSSPAVAASILNEAKASARQHDVKKLDREKSLLIRNINYTLQDGAFYDQYVSNYRECATAQMLVNEWRSGEPNVGKLAEYEDRVTAWLTAEKHPDADHAVSSTPPGESKLLVKTMMKKLNERYSAALNDEQKSIVRSYLLSVTSDDPAAIIKKLGVVRESLLVELDTYVAANPEQNYINQKLADARKKLLSETLVSVDDDTVTRFMLYVKLREELKGEEKTDV